VNKRPGKEETGRYCASEMRRLLRGVYPELVEGLAMSVIV